MTNLLYKIQTNFNKASSSYDSVSIAQKEAGDFLVNKLLETQNFNPKTILDLGVGTGYISELLLKTYPESFYSLNDIAEQMLEICKVKFINKPNFIFLHSDMRALGPQNYDLIISNLALQWVDDLKNIIETLYDKSTKALAFSTLLDGTFKEWQNIVNKYEKIEFKNYPAEEDLANYCDNIKGKNSFEYWTIHVPVNFDTALLFIKYLKSLGVLASSQQMSASKLRLLLKEHNKSIIASYKIFFGIFIKR
jgi:malonyl-CoA O-methyltransferase